MLQIRTLQPADQPLLEAFVLPRIASSLLLLGNSRRAGLIDRGEPFQGTYAGAFEAGALVGVVGHFWNGNAVIQAERHAVALCRHALGASERPLAGLLGPAAQVGAVLAALSIEPARLRLDSLESLFQLALPSLRIPAALASGAVRARRARPEDLALLTAWSVAFDIETLNASDTPELHASSRRGTSRAIDDSRLWVAEHDAAPVAMTAFVAVTAEAVQVGGVFTPRPLRGRGYARAAVAQSLIDMRARGVQSSLLFTGDDNQAAQHAYRALGYERVGDYRLCLLPEPLRVVPGART